MTNLDQYLAYADAFETTLEDDDWARLMPFFAEDVTYRNAEGDVLRGRDAAIAYLEASVNGLDRRFDSRAFVGEPIAVAVGDEVRMTFTVRYEKTNLPALILSGTEVASFADGLIQRMDDVFDDAASEGMASWMDRHHEALLQVAGGHRR
jgi:hypothetical protein